jgi:hypothetical protein
MFLFFHFLFLLLLLSVELEFCLHSSTTSCTTSRCHCDLPHSCTERMLPPSMGMTQSYPSASPVSEQRVKQCPSCINNNISSGGQKLCVDVTSYEVKEVDCSVAKTDDDSDIQDSDCDVMLQSCEEVLTDEPNDVACACQREKRSFTRTGSLPKKWKDSVNSRTKAWGRSMAPPYRVTPDGTIVNYWCDLPRKSLTGSRGMLFAVSFV